MIPSAWRSDLQMLNDRKNFMTGTVSENNTSAYAEAEIIPASIVVGFIHSNALSENTGNERERTDYPMPKSTKKPCRFGTLDLVFRIRTSD
jgi:hypothetical protein